MNPTFSSFSNRRWMLVDDNAGVLMLLSAMAENLTTATIECHDSPQSALAAYATAPNKYELVITDFEMPGMDGVELCRHLRAISSTQKIFVATGSGMLSETAARQHGFSALLNKPFPLEALLGALAAAGLENECARTI
jgi:two-component system cell cycle sensor histidine kinase/response regulator CckA